MGLSHSPRIVTNGLVFAVDAANTKSYRYVNLPNMFSYSEDFGNIAWTKSNITISSNAITGPIVNSVTLNADKIQETAVTGQFLLNQNPYTAVSNDVNTISVYAKAGERTQLTLTSFGEGYAVFNLDTGTIHQTGGHVCSIESVGDGWYRCRATITEVNVTTSRWYIGAWKNNQPSYAGTVGEGLYIAGAQFERNTSSLGTYSKTVELEAAWNDLSGNGYNGTVRNGAIFEPDVNGSLRFDRVDDNVRVLKPNPNITGTITLDFWIKFITSNQNVPVHKGVHFSILMTPNSWGWADSSNWSYANFVTRTYTGLYALNQWYHFVVTKNETFDVSIYRNGILLDTRAAFGGALIAANTTLFLNGYSDTDANPTTNMLNGNMAAVKIYNRVLSATEIEQNFNALRGRFGI